MLKKNDQIKIIDYCVHMMEFCQEASKAMAPTTTHSESMQKTCEGLSKIFSSLGEDFESIAKMVMKGFTKKEIKTILASSKKELKKHKQEDEL